MCYYRQEPAPRPTFTVFRLDKNPLASFNNGDAAGALTESRAHPTAVRLIGAALGLPVDYFVSNVEPEVQAERGWKTSKDEDKKAFQAAIDKLYALYDARAAYELRKGTVDVATPVIDERTTAGPSAAPVPTPVPASAPAPAPARAPAVTLPPPVFISHSSSQSTAPPLDEAHIRAEAEAYDAIIAFQQSAFSQCRLMASYRGAAGETIAHTAYLLKLYDGALVGYPSVFSSVWPSPYAPCLGCAVGMSLLDMEPMLIACAYEGEQVSGVF